MKLRPPLHSVSILIGPLIEVPVTWKPSNVLPNEVATVPRSRVPHVLLVISVLVLLTPVLSVVIFLGPLQRVN